MNEFIMEVDIMGAEESHRMSSESWKPGRLSSFVSQKQQTQGIAGESPGRIEFSCLRMKHKGRPSCRR